MDLNQLIGTLRRHWFVAVCAFAVVMALGIAAAMLPQKQYDATATVLISPNSKTDPQAALTAVQVGLSHTAALVNSRSFGVKVEEALFPIAVRRSNTTVTAATNPDSGVLTINASGPNAAATAPIANAYAKRLISTSKKTAFWVPTMLDRAVPPTSPSSPIKGPILIGAFVLGVIAALLTALLAGALSKRRGRADALRADLGTSVLAELPNAPSDVRKSDRLWATLDLSGAPRLIEALQRLRTNVELAIPHSPEGFVLSVTSAGEGEGKSTIAANLAWLLASVGHDVVLIDADLRHPSLSALLSQRPGNGLSAAASEPVTELLQPTGLSTLKLLPAGTPARHPAEVISTALPRALHALRAPERIVIVDAPPLGAVAETAMIASITGASVLVIDTRQREPEEIELAVLELQDRGSHLVGIVLNRLRRHQLGRWAHGYRGVNLAARPRENAAVTTTNGHSPKIKEPAAGGDRSP